MKIEKTRAYRYAEECADPENPKVGKYVKKQAAAWLEICNGNSDKAYVDEKTVELISKILRLIIHPDLHVTMSEGLEDYAQLMIYAVFATKQSGTGYRYYQKALLEIARKNFKTFTSAVIFIIAMLTEPRFSRFFSVAPDLKLSSELQVALKKIIRSSPALADKRVFKTLRSETRCLLTESEFTPLAYSQDRMDGHLANMFLADEAGAMDGYPIDAMESSQITLLNKLGIIISTQYPNDNNALSDEIDMAKKTLDGLLDERYFALLYEPDDEYRAVDAWKTADNAIYQANPVAVSLPYVFDNLIKKRNIAILYKNKRQNFLCKHLNICYKSLGAESYVEVGDLRQCRIINNKEWWRGKKVYIGLDLSLSEDNTSVAMVTYFEGKIYAAVWGFIPEDAIEDKTAREKVDYERLINDGVCFACGDRIVDYGFIENFVLGLREEYGVEIVQLGFDRWNAISSVQKFESADNPIDCVEIKQHSSVLHVPTKLLKEYILSQNFCYFDNRLLEINFENARCTEDTNLNKYVNKKRSVGKVDMVFALINAIFLLNVNELLQMNGWGAQAR